MWWHGLLSDLEAQWDAASAAEQDAEVAERSRGEVGRLRLLDRLAAVTGHPVVLAIHGVDAASRLRGRLTQVGPDWLLLDEGAGREALVALSALLWVEGVTRSTVPEGARSAARVDLRMVLRGVARDRSAMSILLGDSSLLTGTVDRVGADHLDLAMHEPGEQRRTQAVRAVRTVPLAALAVLRRT